MTELTLTDQHRDLLALCAARVGEHLIDWNLIARNAQTPDDLQALLSGRLREDGTTAVQRNRALLHEAIKDLDPFRAWVDKEVEAARAAGAGLVTVLDPDYPANLRLVPNLPPFLFYRGQLSDRDARSIAVVGTRQASEAGLRRAARMARELVEHDVVIISGLAKGIDHAAHDATLRAGGRTVAVMGTGIAAPVYPAENRPLAAAILERGGALLSQFWPTSPPARWTFPKRNVVTSGTTLGSVVIEASSTSGAKMQARIAAEHGKKVFLIRSLATSEAWAEKMIKEGRAIQVSHTSDIVECLGTAESVQRVSEQRQQLALAGL